MHNKILTTVAVALLFFYLGLRTEEFLASLEPVMPCEKMQAEIYVYNLHAVRQYNGLHHADRRFQEISAAPGGKGRALQRNALP